MAYSARIDELEKKFSENARRYFAPLANEYRKAGDLDRAIEICRAHLPQQPGHMSGHIVYGQALYESRQLDEAKTVFEAALALDPENLIALRHLGDIARDSADAATARSWYLRVLDADPRNDDVAALLAELDAAAAAAPAETAQPAADGASGWGDINPERTTEGAADEPSGGEGDATDSAPQAREPESPADELEVGPEPDQASAIGLEPMPGDASVDEVLGTATPETSRPQKDVGDGVSRAAREQPSLDRVLNEAFAADADTQEMEAGDVASAAFASPDAGRGVIAPASETGKDAAAVDEVGDTLGDAAFAEVDALFDEIASEGSSAVASPVRGAKDSAGEGSGSAARPGSSAGTSSSSGEALFGDAEDTATTAKEPTERLDGLETSEFVAPTRAPEPATPRRTTGSMAVTGLTTFEQPSEEDSSTRAAFVTETMAELYLQQGFTAEALDIYRQLLQQNPSDTSLRDRIEQLERGGQTSLSVAAVSSEVIHAAQQRHAARPVRTARAFFGRLAGQQVGQATEAPDMTMDAPADGPPEETIDAPAHALPDSAPASEGPPAERAGSRTPAAPDRVPAARVPTGAGIAVVSDLFGDVKVSEADEAAASMLASAFTASFGEPPAPAASATPPGAPAGSTQGRAGTGRPARAGGRELSLDQVFRDSENRQPRKSGAFSFDQFFSDGTQTGGPDAPAPDEAPGEESAEDPEGDLEQFTAWLEGLKRK